METLTIIKRFEISEDNVFCFSAGAERMAIDAFRFECAPKQALPHMQHSSSGETESLVVRTG